jgi:antitoxin HigA-1
MRMHNPPHPGEFIREVYFNAPDVDPLTIAAKLDVPPAALIRLLEGEASVTVEMVCRLSKTLGRSPESWLAMQNSYDLWRVQDYFSLMEIEKIEFALQ